MTAFNDAKVGAIFTEIPDLWRKISDTEASSVYDDQKVAKFDPNKGILIWGQPEHAD